MNNRKYLGTGGTRSCVGDALIIPDFVLKLGWTAGKVLARRGLRETIIGKDMRISSYVLESALETGLVIAGLSASFIGSVLTSVIVCLVRAFHAEAGIVISVSHNPYYGNGIKFFFTNGTRLSDAVGEATEAEMERATTCVDSAKLGKTTHIVDAAGHYTKFCKGTLPNELSLNELKTVADYASGAMYHITPNILRKLGAGMIAVGYEPNGANTSEEVSATDARALQVRVITEKTNLDIVLDDDDSRVTMADHEGNKVDGDQIMYIIAREALRQGQLHDDAVGILMNNMGPELALKQLGIPFAHVKIGGRYVLEKIQEKGWCISAENSGHVVLPDKATTDDGIMAGLRVLAVMMRNHMSLHDLCNGMKMLPQPSVNVRCTAGNDDSLEHGNVKAMMVEVEAALGNRGRVLLRKLDTEPSIRVIVKGEDKAQAAEFAYRIVDAVKVA